MQVDGPDARSGILVRVMMRLVMVVMMVMAVLVMMMMPFAMVVTAVMVVMAMRMLVIAATSIAFAINSNVLRPAAAYLAHGYLPFLIVEGLLAEGSPA